MAKIGFYGANREWRVGGSITAESFRKSMRFDRIAHRRSSAVGLNEADRLRHDSSIHAGISHHPRLRLRAAQRDTACGSILIDRRPQNHALNRIAILERSRKSLEQNHASAFTTYKPAGADIEGGASALWRKHGSLRKPDKPARRNHHSDASCQGNVSTPGPD